MLKYLLEIGTEELPYKFIPSAMEQLKESFAKTLEENRITFTNIITYGTPRRLTVIIENVAESQPDLVKKIKGPPAKTSYGEQGELTQAALGFAKKQGVDPESFYIESVGDVEYVFAQVKDNGKNSSEVLQSIIPDIVLKLQGSHFMRWGDLDIKFSRPIRWMVSLLGNEEVKIKIGNVESSRLSRGHRFFDKQDFSGSVPNKSENQAGNILISSPDSYLKELYEAHVIVDPEVRKKEVINLAKNIAESVNGQAHLDNELVDEVTYLVEWPVPILGSFDPKYLVIPKDVIITVMASHQRYFPVFSKNSKDLLNYFITMSNIDEKSVENIKKGNQRVIKARLDDAIFFYTEDTKRTLESRIEDLKGVTFQKGLGTVWEKSERIREISSFIAKKLNLSSQITEDVEKTAMLCKADLVTSLVREFTELQGIIGSEYARLEGQNELVVQGIREHYQPLSSDDEPANSITGQIVGISDKIDTIAGVFALSKAPTGSADPLGLRRAALGILLTLIKKDININLSEVIYYAVSAQSVQISNQTSLTDNIRDFIIQRLRIYLNDSYRYDVVEAALSAKDPLADVKDLLKRVEVLSKLVKEDNYSSFHEAANRIHRIIKAEKYNSNLNESLFNHNIEKQLWECAKNIDENSINYDELVIKLQSCIPIIEKFFEEVLVMDPDMAVRENRLALLGTLRDKFLKLADFSKIVA